ncbi:unnamed protein product [Lactuca saligna]|uniref:Leucine-rich repeat-containing N-terminal plant-type domain-containing protein n=1 Tax=Lactuca saligna TaxID=75948 RepID=A0AA36DYY3_LACSI|nr:unnamed protein product [Lactuca saligna]
MTKQIMSSSNLLFFSITLLIITLSPIPNFTSASLEEADALLKWKASLEIPKKSLLSSRIPILLNSSASVPCTYWFGVVCNADGSIQRLNLTSSGLKVELGNLKSLTDLQLSVNQLNGSIPSSLGHLTSLNFLYLFQNQLFGPIHVELGNLKSLTHLAVSENQLNGSIPSSLGDLTSLNVLYLH